MNTNTPRARLLVTLFSMLCMSILGGLVLQFNTVPAASAGPAQQGFASATPTQTATRTRTPLPTSTPPNGLAVTSDVDLKSILSFGFGSDSEIEACPTGFRFSAPDIYSMSAYIHHHYSNGGGDICVQAVPVEDGDVLTLQLFNNSQSLLSTTSLIVEKDSFDSGRLVTNDYLRREVGKIFQARRDPSDLSLPLWDMMQIQVNMAYPLPAEGHWVLTTPNTVMKTYDDDLLPSSGNVILLNPTDYLIGYEACPILYPGDSFAVRVLAASPNASIPVGIYTEVPNPQPLSIEKTAQLIAGQYLYSNSAGTINAVMQVPSWIAPGTYFLSAPGVSYSCYFQVVEPPAGPTPTLVPPSSSSSTSGGVDSDFYEGFSGASLDPTTWRVENTTYYTSVDGGVFDLYGSGARFPFVRSVRSLFPSYADYSAEINFRYLENNPCGVGVMMTSKIPTAGLSAAQSNAEQYANETSGVAIGFWQDTSGMKLWYRAGSERKDIYLGGPDTDWHDLWVEYSNNRYSLYMDNNFYFESQPTYSRLDGIWMGNPQYLGAGASCDWSALEMDYISIKQ